MATSPREFFSDLLGSLANLRVDRASGDPAPHKPLLLLTILDMAEEQYIPDPLPLTPELAFRFCTYWTVVAHRRRQRPDIRLPFHHLAGDGIWHPLLADGTPSPDSRLSVFSAFSPAFRALMADPVARDRARRLLIAKYFTSGERAALYAIIGRDVPDDEQIEHDAQVDDPLALAPGREARFRLQVVAKYDYTCALTGYRLLTIDAGSIVDAAHIHQFADSRNNDPRNGIALCKNAHWLFDEGLWTIDEDLRVLVARGHFAEMSPDGRELAAYEGCHLRLPKSRDQWPGREYVQWHRQHCFLGRA